MYADDLFSVIRARVREVRNRGLEPTAVVEVKEVIKSSLVNIPKETQTLYYSSSCLCPTLSPGEDYLIMGYEHEETSRYEKKNFKWIIKVFVINIKLTMSVNALQIAADWRLHRSKVEGQIGQEGQGVIHLQIHTHTVPVKSFIHIFLIDLNEKVIDCYCTHKQQLFLSGSFSSKTYFSCICEDVNTHAAVQVYVCVYGGGLFLERNKNTIKSNFLLLTQATSSVVLLQ